MCNPRHSLPRRSFSRQRPRKGIAVVEFAVCMPVIMVIVFASIEACSMVFLKIDLQTTAYETARVAVTPTGTTDNAIGRGNEVLTQRNVSGGSIQINPSSAESAPVGGLITVTVTAPVDSNRVIAGWFFSGGNLTSTCAMVREGTSAH